ncbi:MAG TPA: HAD family hydrolase [Sedimentibacter sp.]|jgi:2-hydroxy-3-keto-5-methylthiopentenyl-1-phosphate phosphatase|nr:HAD family hydrolase [Sedimentibacter sp.]HPV85319.1 HAD family hydrolase [Sedimentibacter sp.]HQK54789.1 HAD family hydrolase [Sedimentibacter sp.]
MKCIVYYRKEFETSMNKKPIVAIMYDFDKTLSPKDMQEYGFISELGMKSEDFWEKSRLNMVNHNMDQILAYMLTMLQEAEGRMLLTRNIFNEMGRNVKLFEGLETWFDRINLYGEKLGLEIEHYIISSGLKEIIQGTEIAHNFKEIYAAEYCYNENNIPIWPAMAVNYTSKTQFLFRINKGVLDVTEHKGLNESTPDNKKRIPFCNMIYIGDGLTDVPCMKLVKINGGHSIAVYHDDRCIADSLISQGRVDFVVSADYRENSEMEKTVQTILNQIAALNKVLKLHTKHMKNLITD